MPIKPMQIKQFRASVMSNARIKNLPANTSSKQPSEIADELLIKKMAVIHRAYELAEKRQDPSLLQRATELSQKLFHRNYTRALRRYLARRTPSK